ncbi:MAG: CRISPR-associated endonuclease Cas2 [Lentisphaeria bacterium]|nr:CRISPR-associated endonuclease Cas2 [Lentisphaeria bacterium]
MKWDYCKCSIFIMRSFFLVSYDVTDDKRRSRIAKLMLGYGERIQQSVFCCQLNPREMLHLKEDIKQLIHPDDDQVLFLNAGSVIGFNPLPELQYIGRTWKPEIRAQII